MRGLGGWEIYSLVLSVCIHNTTVFNLLFPLLFVSLYFHHSSRCFTSVRVCVRLAFSDGVESSSSSSTETSSVPT